MENLAWVHYTVSYEEESFNLELPQLNLPQLNIFPDAIPGSAWIKLAGIIAALAVLAVPFQAALAALQSGDRGAEVTQLQQHLGISADGIFGLQTNTAVRTFQQQHGLSVDGIVGPQTASALKLDTVRPAYYSPVSTSPQTLYVVTLDPGRYTGLNVRQGAGVAYPVINGLPNGTVIEVTGEQGDRCGYTWAQLSNGGWVAKEFLTYYTPVSTPSPPPVPPGTTDKPVPIGIPGPKGDQGLQGPMGPQGPKGDPGPKGDSANGFNPGWFGLLGLSGLLGLLGLRNRQPTVSGNPDMPPNFPEPPPRERW
jgi:hypothetical protein